MSENTPPLPEDHSLGQPPAEATYPNFAAAQPPVPQTQPISPQLHRRVQTPGVVSPGAYSPPAPPAPNYPSASYPVPGGFAPGVGNPGFPHQPQMGIHTPPTAGAAPFPSSMTPENPPQQRFFAAPIVVSAVIAGLIGSAAGVGLTSWALSSQNQPSSFNIAGTPESITINNPDRVNLVTAVAAKAAPSVVTLTVTSRGSEGSGSGVILSEDGYVLTNNHVVTLDGASANGNIEVVTADGQIAQATVVGLDPIVDLAVLKMDRVSALTPIEWGESSTLNVGDPTIAIGAPLGLPNTVTEGIVSALNRSIQVGSSAVPDESGDLYDDPEVGGGPFDFWNFGPGPDFSVGTGSGSISIPVIQTDAAINPGNSGGALVDAEGKLIGINVAIATTGESFGGQPGSIGVGFAIPAKLAQRVAEEIIANGTATHGLLGASVVTATSADSPVVGAVIREVSAGGAAESAGVRVGDVVVGFGGLPITSSIDLTAQVRALAAGATADIDYLRNGETRSVQVTLGKLS